MASKEWNSIDNAKFEFEEYYCAFLDILGYKNKSQEFFKNKFNLYGRIDRAFSTTNMIFSLTDNFFDKSQKKIMVFSDSIIIYYPLGNDNLNKLFHDVGTICVQFSMEGLFLRGGISRGKHFESITKNSNIPFLSSHALERAYSIEQKACYPRIIIDKLLIDEFNDDTKLYLIKNNYDYIIHFAKYLINNNLDKQAVYEEMKDIEDLMSSVEENIKIKYKWLLEYYFWTIKNDGSYELDKFKRFISNQKESFELI